MVHQEEVRDPSWCLQVHLGNFRHSGFLQRWGYFMGEDPPLFFPGPSTTFNHNS